MRESALSEFPAIPDADCEQLAEKTDNAANVFEESYPRQFDFIKG